MDDPRSTSRVRIAAMVALSPVASALIALPYNTFGLDRFLLPKEMILHATALVAWVLLIGVRRRRVELSSTDVLLGGFLLLTVVSALGASNPWLAWRAVAITMSSAALFWIGRRLSGLGLANMIMVAVAVTGVAAAATALVQTYAGTVTEVFSFNRAPGGTLGNRNFVAHLAAISLSVVVVSAVCSRRRRSVALALVATMILTAALVVTRSRGAWIAAAAALAVIAMLGWRNLRSWNAIRRVGLLVVVAATAGMAAAYIPNELDWRSDSPYLDSVRDLVNFQAGSGRGRAAQYANSMMLVRRHPLLGVGPGNWPVEYPRAAPKHDPSLAHDAGTTENPWPSSDWIAFVSERGIPATACLMALLLILVVSAIKHWRRRDEQTESSVPAHHALAAAGTLVAAGFVGLFDVALLVPTPSNVVWLAAGALIPAGRPLIATKLAGRSGWIAPAASVAIGAVLVLALARNVGQVRAMRLANDSRELTVLLNAATSDPGNYRLRILAARAALALGNCETARVQAEAARSLFPTAYEPRAVLFRCREGQ